MAIVESPVPPHLIKSPVHKGESMSTMSDSIPAVFDRKSNVMKAAVLEQAKHPLALQEVEIPRLEPDEVLVKVEVCGVCHSDLSIIDGDWSQMARLTKT